MRIIGSYSAEARQLHSGRRPLCAWNDSVECPFDASCVPLVMGPPG